MINKPTVLGVDIGGTHITTALVDLKTGTLSDNRILRAPVDSRIEAEEILDTWAHIIQETIASSKSAITAIGIAMPGPFDYENGISLIKEQDKFKSLYQVNIRAELAKRLDMEAQAIHFMNDAASFLQGEVYSGAANGYRHVLGLTLGTGLGSATAHEGIAEDAALWCAPFKNSIAEDYLSTKWFIARYETLTGKQLKGVKELVDDASNSSIVTQIFKEFSENLAEFLIPIIHDTQVEVVILGGNIAQAFRLFSSKLMEILRSENILIEVKLSVLNEHATLIGAASKCDVDFSNQRI